MKRFAQTILTILAIGIVLWLPRAAALEHVVTVDERKWFARAANFNYAVAQQDWAATFQREHPGVTVMWAGALGIEQAYPEYTRESPGYFAWEQEDLEFWLRSVAEREPLDLLNAGRRWIILFIIVAALMVFGGLVELFGISLAFLALLYLSLDPFFVAHSLELHPDGLLAILFLAAAVNFLAWLYGERRWRYLFLSGIALGLAGLTKTPAIFLAPAGVLLALWAMMRKDLSPRSLLIGITVWGGLAVVTVIVAWPALWVNPVGTLSAVVVELRSYAEGHINPNYFMGQVSRDPGPLFYPLAFLMRSTPTTLFGLAVAVVLRIGLRWPFSQKGVRRGAGGLVVIALLFGLGINLGAKKFDRYFLPAMLCLDVVAVLGLAGFIHLIVQFANKQRARSALHTHNVQPAVFSILLVVVLAGHGLSTLRHRPYFLTYYNPLLGGAQAAQRILMIGWGEGLDEAAAWLNAQPEADSNDIVAWYGDGSLSYFLARTRPVLSYWQPDFWLSAEYAVVYVNQEQRSIPSEPTLRAVENGELLHTVELQGVDWARIYRMPAEIPDWVDLSTESATTFDDKIEFAAYTLGEKTVLAGDDFLIRLHLRKLVDTSTSYRQVVQLLSPDDEVVWRDEATIDASSQVWQPYAYLHSFAELTAPARLSSGTYRIAVSYCDVLSPNHCLTPDGGGLETDPDAHVITEVAVERSIAHTQEYNWKDLRLFDLRHDAVFVRGATALINLAADVQTDVPLKLSLRLVDRENRVVAQSDVEILATMEIALDLPLDITPGEYALAAVVYDPATLDPLPDLEGNFETRLIGLQIGRGEE